MMQKRIDESFWDGLGVEIEACADFPQKVGFRENFPGPGKKSRPEKKISDWMLWVVRGTHHPYFTPGGCLMPRGITDPTLARYMLMPLDSWGVPRH